MFSDDRNYPASQVEAAGQGVQPPRPALATNRDMGEAINGRPIAYHTRARAQRGASPTPASVDAELLALAAEFQTVDARLMAINQEISADTTGTLSMEKDKPAAVHDRWWAIVNRVIELPAHTQAGWTAKAAVIPPVIRELSSTDIGTADINLALSLARDLTGQVDASPDAELLTACEVFQAVHREMKDPRRGDTDSDDDALGLVVERWYTALDAEVAILARTAEGQQAKLRTVYTALWDAMKDEPLFGNRKEFATLVALRELLGDAADPAPRTSCRREVSNERRTDAPAAQDDVEALLAASEVADNALFDLESAFFDMRADIAIIGHIATSERVVGPEVWRRIEDHLDLAIDTLEEIWKLAQERRHALRDAFETEQAAHKLLRRTRNADAQPGSPADIEDAETLWGFMQTISRMVLKRDDEAAPAA